MKKFFLQSLLMIAIVSTAFTTQAQTADEVIDKYIAISDIEGLISL